MGKQNPRKDEICYTIIGNNLFFSYCCDIIDNKESEPIEKIANFMFNEYYIKPIAINTYVVNKMDNLSIILANIECMGIIFSDKLTACKRKFKYEFN